MSALPLVQQHPASVDAYIRHGWSLVPIPLGSKGPTTTGWNQRANALRSQADLPWPSGIGLAHAYSGTAALDIDDWGATITLLAQHGIDLPALYDAPDAVVIDSGNPGHGKLLYAMPFGLALPSKRVSGDTGTVYELRCATSGGLTVQDVLPPSVHPGTKQSYRWAGRGDWRRLPLMPQPLLDLWQSMLSDVSNAASGPVDASWEEIREAVECIPADCSRDEWISVGMALHWAAHQLKQVDVGLAIWDEWSATSTAKYPGANGLRQQWASLRSDKLSTIKLGTLFHLAQQYRWRRPMPDATGLFGPLSPKEPTDILAGLRRAAPDMDLSLWPAILSGRAMEISDAVGCDPLVPLWAGLAAVCGVVDARIRLELMPGYKVPPVLWLMTIGDPADKKSPGSRPMLAPLKALELEDRPRFQRALLAWEAQEAAYNSAKKNFLTFASSSDAMLGDVAPVVPDLPAQPAAMKITVSDITSQKLVRHAAERPRGLLCHLDEMNSWVRKLTDKTTGEDRSAWVVSYESEAYEMDRVMAGSIHCENLAVSIYGNIQPAVFKTSMASLSADGLLQRFIPAILRANKTRLGNPVPAYMTTADAWETTLRLVYALPPQVYRLSADAHDTFRQFQAWYESAKADERVMISGDVFMTAFGKLEGTCGRLALLMHLLEAPWSNTVSVDIVERAVRLVKGYIIPALRYAFGEIGESTAFDQWMTNHVIHYADHPSITLADIRRSGRRPLEGKPQWQQEQMIYGAMHVLEGAKWVSRMDDGTREMAHYAQWAINPALMTQFAAYRAKVIKLKQAQLDEIYKLSTKERPRVPGIDALGELDD